MPALTEAGRPNQGNVMIVDDNPANLKLLEDMLRQHGYEVQSFPRGRMALSAADQEPPDLILLDINMPEMNGYQVCEQLKSSPRLADIPVVFLSALIAVEDKVRGFRSGGVDYISKPFQFDEVEARVETHLKLRRAQQAEHDLLEKTLGGAVETLWELIQLTSPALASRSHSIRDIVRWMTKRMGIGDSWQNEIAATLCLVGCVALPDEVFERAWSGQLLSLGEACMFHAHPATTAQLLSKIPRFDAVAEIIRGQQKPEGEIFTTEPARQGAHILHLAIELDRRLCRGLTVDAALAQLKPLRGWDGPMLKALEGYSPAPGTFDVRWVSIRELCAGMILEKDVMSRDGSFMILKEGTMLTETWIQRLQNFAQARGAQEPIAVRVTRLAPG